jgi:cbb3-type cytochrome oxidase maturation protein
MEIITLLLPMALAIATVFIVAFIWATKNGQYDDLDTPASRILFEDSKYINSKTNIVVKEDEK